MTGTHIDLFLVDGESGGITTADVSGWTGHVLAGPRDKLNVMRERPDAQTNGVYLLIGDDDTCLEGTRCYIGRTESFARRLPNHDSTKSWWNRVYLISSREDAFNEGHWGYLESRLIEIATTARRSTLDDNKQVPRPRKLSEAQESDAEAFLARLLSLLPVLGVNVLRDPTAALTPQRPAESTASPVFTLQVPSRGIHATGQAVNGEFLLLEGSVVASHAGDGAAADSSRRSYRKIQDRYDTYIDDGTLVVDGDTARLTRTVPFTSPSAAGSVVTGRSCNGRTAWKHEGLTYAQWEERDLPATPAPTTSATV